MKFEHDETDRDLTGNERLEKLAKLHDMQKPESLRMESYFDRPKIVGVDTLVLQKNNRTSVTFKEALTGECGTPACSLGWAIDQMPDLHELFFEAYCGPNADPSMIDPDQIACPYFGINYAQYNKLFGPLPATPTEQAEKIRTVIADNTNMGSTPKGDK